MNRANESFSGKILLFGEYSVLLDSKALSIPFDKYIGELKFANTKSGSNSELKKYLNYLKNISTQIDQLMDLERLEDDIDQGLYFDSQIPQSYGVGSSGALCAAIYSKYAIGKVVNNEDLLQLKNIFSILESGFHGKSSGLDPLVSYLNRPVLISGKGKMEPIDLQLNAIQKKGKIFLINSRQKGSTERLVSDFLNKCKSEEYKRLINNSLKPITNRCIDSLCKNQFDEFFLHVKQLSNFQYSHFTDKIPSEFHELWKTGLDSNQFWLKLCGSGGGGFLLAFTTNSKETESFFKKMGYHYQILI